ncbi:transcription initiation factor TFIID subunit 9 [Cylas formicarius]|uniref:transcription initiation factor TFIID subunit 9 n=1 Tax=Cylas formicarius TaxID=197179 RepID=UPI002958B5D2|nr:transcription initiation factor TFIID subunit 9 [Cylas formicarius]
MSEKEKQKNNPPKNIPKDGQVILAIMKEMGITEYEPKTIVQLTEFVYRYATSILEEAKMYATNPKQKVLDVDDIKLALQLTTENSFTMPPPREVVLECASVKNYTLLPAVKPHCGLRLPPDRYCLSSCNYTLKSVQKKGLQKNYNAGAGAMSKMMQKSNISFLKRTNAGALKQTVTKVSGAPSLQQKTILKPKIQITQNIQLAGSPTGSGHMMENSLKRKREEDSELMQT